MKTLPVGVMATDGKRSPVDSMDNQNRVILEGKTVERDASLFNIR
jgi:hypothetical protein